MNARKTAVALADELKAKGPVAPEAPKGDEAPKGEAPTQEEIDAAAAAEAEKVKAQRKAERAARAAEPITIERVKGIPLPTGRAPREQKYPWDELEAPSQDDAGEDVLDSFFIPGAKPSTFQTLTATRNKGEKEKATKDKRYHAKEFTAKKITHNSVEGVCVWRVK